MSTQGERRVRPSFLTWGVALFIAVLVAGAVFGGIRAHERGDLNGFLCDGVCGPEYAMLPDGVGAIGPGSMQLSGSPSGGLDRDAVVDAMTAVVSDPALGPHVGISVREAGSGREILSTSADTFVPASTTKVLTGYAAASVLDTTDRFTTSVSLSDDTLVLVGGGDPYLMTERSGVSGDVDADLTTLADRTAGALRQRSVSAVRLGWDADLFSGPAVSAGWEPTYVPEDIVTPVSALWVDRGVHGGTRDDDPTAYAMELFAQLLVERGIAISGDAGPVPSEAGDVIARVQSAPIGSIIERMERDSDNEAAEVLLRHVGLAASGSGSFEGGIAAVRQVLAENDLDIPGLELHDGSGLSRLNRITPSLLTAVIARSVREMPALLHHLPVAGFTGTLTARFMDMAGAGVVRAKTGTLTGVHSLTGTTVTADGVPVAFAVMADATDDLPALETQAALDRIASALVTCTCGAA